MPKNSVPFHRVCTRPFEWFEVHPDGDVFLCCPAWRKTPAGNLLRASVAEIWNGQNARSARGAVLKGTFQGCNRRRCPHLTGSAPPLYSRSNLPETAPGRAMRKGVVQLPYGPRILNLCFDPSCNLACPSCRNDFLISRGEARWRSETIARKITEEAGPHAEFMILSGFGDPFGSPLYRQMLQDFRPGDFPRLSRIHLHTNGLLWTESTWKQFAAIHPYVQSAEVSIDAASPETYALNRRGGDFKHLLSNLSFIRQLDLQVKISFVVQANNFREIPAFVAMGAEYGFSVYFSQLVNWRTFSPHEYQRRSVHNPDHPDHTTLLQFLERVSSRPHVDLGNLAHLLRNGRKNERCDQK